MFNETVGDHVIPILYTLRDGYDLQYFGARETTKSSITGKMIHTGPDELIILEYLIKVNKLVGCQFVTLCATYMVIPIATEMLSLYQTENRKLHDNGGKNINNPCLSMRYGKSHHRFTFRGQNCSRTDKMKMVCAKRKMTCDPGTVDLILQCQ